MNASTDNFLPGAAENGQCPGVAVKESVMTHKQDSVTGSLEQRWSQFKGALETIGLGGG